MSDYDAQNGQMAPRPLGRAPPLKLFLRGVHSTVHIVSASCPAGYFLFVINGPSLTLYYSLHIFPLFLYNFLDSIKTSKRNL